MIFWGIKSVLSKEQHDKSLRTKSLFDDQLKNTFPMNEAMGPCVFFMIVDNYPGSQSLFHMLWFLNGQRSPWLVDDLGWIFYILL